MKILGLLLLLQIHVPYTLYLIGFVSFQPIIERNYSCRENNRLYVILVDLIFLLCK